VNPWLTTLLVMFLEVNEVCSILVVVVKASPKGGEALLPIEEVLVRLEMKVGGPDDRAADELLAIPHLQDECRTRREPLDDSLEETANGVVVP
jgi:hypothetical protein